MNALLIVNPVAGKKKIVKKLNKIVGQFEKKSYKTEVQFTKGRGDAAKIMAENAQNVQIAVCCGGDGTLSETVSGLTETESRPYVGYIPAGTTNDFAKSLGIPKRTCRAVKSILNGVPFSMDVGQISDRKFLYVASFGIFTRSSYHTPQNLKNIFGHFAYVLEGIKEIAVLKHYSVHVTNGDGTVINGDYIFGAVFNSHSLGGILKLNHANVRLDDGLFEVLLIRKPKNLVELSKIIFQLQHCKFDGDLVRFFHSSELTFTCPDEMPWSLDGEYFDGGKELPVKVLHRAFSLIVPKPKRKCKKNKEVADAPQALHGGKVPAGSALSQ